MAIRKRIAVACVLLAPLAATAATAPQPYRFEPAPDWVTVARDLPLEGMAPVEEGESDYLLVDHQVRLSAVNEHYARFVERLVSQAAVDEGAQLSIDIDPEHERVLLHGISVIRAGHELDKLADSRRSLLNREEELEQQVINGRVTLHVLLQDVRVGDVLDYSYTIERRDPISERGYNDWFSTQWSTPVRRFRLRVLRAPDRPLLILDLSKLAAPHETRGKDWLETRWEARDVAGLTGESARPGWHFQFPRIELSEFADWNAVRNWAMPLYAVDPSQAAALGKLLAELRAEPDEEARILKALRFVQDDIRYTGLEIGAGAYRPSQPAVVLARRFGDCKDKVLLFVTLMRALGVEAHPALVHSRIGRGIVERAPGPGAFDHAIAKLRWKGREFWLDATTSGQGGTLTTLAQADFGLGLVLAPGGNGLETIPASGAGAPAQRVVETFDFRKGTRKSAVFKVVTQYRNQEADDMRITLRTTTATKLGKEYLDYYRKRYAGIRVTKPLAVKDDRALNLLTLQESYEIDTPFEKDDDGVRKFYLQAYLIADHTATPKQTVRETPLAREFPMHVRHEIVAYLPGEWNIEDEAVRIAAAPLEYNSSARFRKGKLELAYDLRHTSDHVAASAMQEFLVKLEKVHDDAYFTLRDRDLPASARIFPGIEFVIALVVGVGLAVWLGWFLWNANPRVRAPQDGAPVGLGGWMILPVIGTCLGPLAMAAALAEWIETASTAGAFDVYGTGTRYLLVLFYMLLSAGAVISLLVPVLLFRRRSSFPTAFVVLELISTAIAVFAWAFVVQNENIKGGDQDMQGLSTVVSLIGSGIWITYMLVSQRVRATFTRPARSAFDPAPVLVPRAMVT